jgi:hypothetical protein
MYFPGNIEKKNEKILSLRHGTYAYIVSVYDYD